jgi:hypothetical protein
MGGTPSATNSIGLDCHNPNHNPLTLPPKEILPLSRRKEILRISGRRGWSAILLSSSIAFLDLLDLIDSQRFLTMASRRHAPDHRGMEMDSSDDDIQQGKKSNGKRTEESDDTDNDDYIPAGNKKASKAADSSSRPASSSSQSRNQEARNINAALKRALAEAANPGIGDEEPEVLPPPENTNQPSSSSSSDYKRGGDELEQPVPKRRGEEKKQDAAGVLEYSNIPFEQLIVEGNISPLPLQNMKERAKYIPLRLTYEERKSLRLVCAAMNVSDYTNAVDIPFKNKARRYHTQLQQIVAFLTALIAANNYEHGQEIFENRNYELYQEGIQEMLEIARRYKITNPEKLRSEYGKLVYLMQDAVSETIQPLLGCSIHRPVRTVHDLLAQHQGLAMLEDPAILIATAEILPEKNKSRNIIQLEIKRKEKAIEHLVQKYASKLVMHYRGASSGVGPALSREEIIRTCLYSISDNNSFLNSNKNPISDCIELLTQYFRPDRCEPGYNLGISEGVEGSRLSHSHAMQYHYVLQSLTLWSVIVEDMFRLWYLAEQDLLNEKIPYDLRNTGQGLQRVQQSPRVYKAMHEILVHVQQSLQTSGDSTGWVGTSVIHLGDHNVPNALVFIDKYTQVSRILGPLITTLKNLEILAEENEGINRYLNSFGGIEKVKKDILFDFFTHAFDGSGGDNFFDAGSCIDGRLTSAWNWCSQLADKPFYALFKLTGFSSFDGQFDK